jgi:hypothetical protein
VDLFYNFCNINNPQSLNTRLPGNLGEIFPLRFRLREELRFFQAGELVIGEKVKSGQRYSVKPWQHEMLMSFDGTTTFEAAAKRTYEKKPGAFTANGLLNFYNWLYSENLVLCECDSIFELVLGDPELDRDDDESGSELGLSDFAGRLLEDSRVRRGLAVTVAIVFSLSVIRLVYVAAPVFEPPVNRLYAELGNWFSEETPAGTIAESQRAPVDSSVATVELSARVVEPAPVVNEEPSPQGSLIPEPMVAAAAPLPSAPVTPVAPVSRIETLRTQLEECRIRRDEFYLQNDEEGYRREVHRMTNLAREIGDIEKGR